MIQPIFIFYSDKLKIFLKTKSRKINFGSGVSADVPEMPGFIIIGRDFGLVRGVAQDKSVFVGVFGQPTKACRVFKSVVEHRLRVVHKINAEPALMLTRSG